MKPIVILPPDTMSEDNITALRENGICVVVAKNPAAVKFIDPIPSQSSRTQIEDAAIKLSRILLNKEGLRSRSDITALYCDILIKGTPLDANPPPTQEQLEQERKNEEHAIFDYAKRGGTCAARRRGSPRRASQNKGGSEGGKGSGRKGSQSG